MKIFRELFRDGRFSLAVVLLFILAILAFLSIYSPYDPLDWQVVQRDSPPSWQHLLGTTSMGQDVFWQLTFAIRNSVTVAILGAGIAGVIAATVGLVAGYYGGIVDRVLMSLSDGFMVLPIFLILVLAALLVKEYMNMITMALLFGLAAWAWNSRLIRSQILSLREREFTYTAILSGTSAPKLIFTEYIPFIIPLLLGTSLNVMAWIVGMEITLAQLGLTNLNIPTLGAMLRWAISYNAMLLNIWWWLAAPIGVAIVLFIGLYLVSVSVSVYLDPRARIQRVGAR